MKFHPQLISATLIKRYKRFLADVILPDNNKITVHCPNPGSMLGLNTPNAKVWISKSNNPKRKLAYTLELIEVESVNTDNKAQNTLVGVNTNIANKIARQAVEAGMIKSIPEQSILIPEQKYGENSRIDFLIKTPKEELIYLEVKSVTLMRMPFDQLKSSNSGIYEFPDSVTKRGTKHLEELIKVVQSGHRAIMLFLTQRDDGHKFAIAKDIDPIYFSTFKKAHKMGVEMLCIQCKVTNEGIFPEKLVEIILEP